MMARLENDEIERRLQGGSWSRDGDAITREWSLENFERAIEFVDRVAAEAELANHHPDILVHGWNKVRLTLSTHSEGGLTEADFHLAGRLDSVAELF
jgi:4a-hydroxytetrahydrobiopterin dehydratase